MSLVDHTPSQSTKAQRKLEIRSLREVISSCDKLNFNESTSVAASLESVTCPDSARGSNTSWVGSFHDKMQAKSPARYGTFATGTPTHRQLNFSTPIPSKIERPSPTVSSVYSDRWCIESMTPGMRFTPPSMAMRGMRMNVQREALGAYRLDASARRENERGVSLCILPTPLLSRQPLAEVSPTELPSYRIPSKPSPTISLCSPTPVGPVHKKPRANSRHFPIPRPIGATNRSRHNRSSVSTDISKLSRSSKVITE
jgi:hypothetical protein